MESKSKSKEKKLGAKAELSLATGPESGWCAESARRIADVVLTLLLTHC